MLVVTVPRALFCAVVVAVLEMDEMTVSVVDLEPEEPDFLPPEEPPPPPVVTMELLFVSFIRTCFQAFAVFFSVCVFFQSFLFGSRC